MIWMFFKVLRSRISDGCRSENAQYRRGSLILSDFRELSLCGPCYKEILLHRIMKYFVFRAGYIYSTTHTHAHTNHKRPHTHSRTLHTGSTQTPTHTQIHTNTQTTTRVTHLQLAKDFKKSWNPWLPKKVLKITWNSFKYPIDNNKRTHSFVP